MKFSAKTLFALIGVVLALIMFFLPFASASMSGLSESANAFSVMFDADDIGDLCIPFFVWVAFLGLIASLVLLFLGKAAISGVVDLVCGVCLLLYIVTFQGQSISMLGVTASIHVGAGSWLALIFFLAAGVFALFGDKFPFLSKVKVDAVTDKLDTAAASFQKTAGKVTSSVQAGVQAAVAKAAAGKEIDCPNCGAKVPADSNFCLNCGAKVEHPAPAPEAPQADAPQAEAPAGRTCANCGGPLKEDSRFCPNCGTPC